MIAPIVLWLLQNFLQVLIMGICTVPDMFMMSLIMYAVLAQPHKDRQIVFIWIAFVGGLIWDLRWTNIPGLTAALNGILVSLACSFWNSAPAQGRSSLLFAAMLAFAQAVSGFINYIFWTVPSQVAIRQFVVQMLISVPVIAIISLIHKKASEEHV